MNETFNRFLSGVSNVANTAVKATGELVEKGKKQVNLMALENHLSKAEAKLGATVYGQIKAGSINTDDLAHYVASIDELHTEIAKVKAQQAAAAGAKASVKTLCPMCGTEVEDGAMFCNGCGNKL